MTMWSHEMGLKVIQDQPGKHLDKQQFKMCHIFESKKNMCHTNSNSILVSLPVSQYSQLHTYSSAQLRHLNRKVNWDNRLQVLPPGKISRIKQPRINRRPIRVAKQPCITNNCNWDNLVYITVTIKIGKETTSTIKLATLNARSVNN